jgi:hypothetical protein
VRVGDAAVEEATSPATDVVRAEIVSTRRLAGTVAVIIATTIGLGIAAAGVRLKALQFPGRDDLIYLFNLDSEFNVPTTVSVIGLTSCAGLLAVVASAARTRAPRDARRFAVLAVVFLYLALDEGARLHERLNEPMAALGFDSGYLRFGWVVVLGLLVLAMIPIYLPTVWRLPPLIRGMFLVAAGLYVSGALLFEMLGADVYDPSAPLYVAITVVEETMELAGIGLFLVALRLLLERWTPVLEVELRHPPG